MFGDSSWILLTDFEYKSGEKINICLNPYFFHFFDGKTEETLGYPDEIVKFRKDSHIL